MITQLMKEQLFRAIEQANGTQKYLNDDGTPRCVVSQLAIMCGVSVESLRRWDRMAATNSCAINVLFSRKLDGEDVPELDKLSHFHAVKPLNAFDLLTTLQYKWDGGEERAELVAFVRDLPVSEPG